MPHKAAHPVTRREALCRIGNGFGMLAFAGMVGESLASAATLTSATQLDPKVRASGGLHHPAKAKHVIFLFMNGGLSQVDSFDPKPMLDKYHGQPLPGGQIATERLTTENNCTPRDMRHIGGGKFIFGYNVQLGLRTETRLADVFALYEYRDRTFHPLPLEGLIDFEKERERLQNQIDKLEVEGSRLKGQLSNQNFVERAPAEKVQELRDRMAEIEQQSQALNQNINALG